MPTVDQLIQYLRDNNHVSEQNPIIARDLAIYFNISDNGTEVPMRKEITNAISQGELIGSCNKGYYIMDSLDEIEHNLNSLRSRAKEILIIIRNMLNSWNDMPNQQNETRLQNLEII